MHSLLERYRRLAPDIVGVIIAETLVQFANSAFFITFLLYMQEHGYADQDATAYFKYRFLGVLALAFPLGRFLRGRRIRPFFYVSSVGVPFASLLVIYAVRVHSGPLLIAGNLLWGVAYMCMTVAVLPYIMRNAQPETQTAAISLSFSTWSFTTIVAGLMIFALRWLNGEFFTHERLLQGFSLLALVSFVFIWRIRTPERVPARPVSDEQVYDWGLIVRAMIPTCLIAVGAGLTIPFMPLFFANIHGFATRHVAVLSAAGTAVVLGGVILTPVIKETFGYRRAIPGTQLIAIAMLVGLASTEYIAPWSVAAVLAAVFYVLRQPLMNLAGPMTSELTMNYVGPRNQELVSALTSSVWSGSWFVSGFAFQKLREFSVSYANIFFITGALYLVGVGTYYLLILDYDRRKLEELRG